MIGMADAKSAVLKQLRFLVVNRGDSDGHFLNTVLTGNPGCGKTTLARILFSIWKCTNSLGSRCREQTFTICRRSDLIAKYLGQTADKCRKFLSKVQGVLFIDEAYSLCYSDTDEYGHIALDCINEWLTHNQDTVCIIAGYHDQLEKHFFSQNPGLRRRFAWRFHIDNYNAEDLAKIFLTQINTKGWKLRVDLEDVKEIFDLHKKHFKDNGGSTDKLCFCCKLQYSERVFPRRGSKIITKRDLLHAVEEFIRSSKKEGDAVDEGPSYMYS
tara:strand:+ start:572 stop:1381 length:810 start_codon:yes stop_codon:yes gene_type:complete